MKIKLCSKKNKNALANNLKVIYCVGENLDDYKKSKTKKVLDLQLSNIFNKES